MSAQATQAFRGFPPETMDYLAALRQNNNKHWFDAHRSDYEHYYLEPAKAFVQAAGAKLDELAPGIRAEPRVLGSIFRINRDTRFSADKRPYKDHLDLWFWEGDRKQAVSGFFVRVTPEFIGVGAGSHGLQPDRLAAYREAVTHPASGPKLAILAKELTSAGYELGGRRYKRVPSGFEVSDPRLIELLKHDALFVHIEQPSDVGTTERLLDTCEGHWMALAPLHRWLVDEVQLRDR
jgi:uncharacterized protein (TIGR02453 family)